MADGDQVTVTGTVTHDHPANDWVEVRFSENVSGTAIIPRALLARTSGQSELVKPAGDVTGRIALLLAAVLSADVLLAEAAADVMPPRPGPLTYRQHIENWLRGAGQEETP